MIKEFNNPLAANVNKGDFFPRASSSLKKQNEIIHAKGRLRGMWKRLLLSILILAWLSPLTLALAQSPPDGLEDSLKTIAQKGYAASFNNRGWGSVYDLPQSQFSLDTDDFFDNSNEFGKIGLYAAGLDTLLNPQFSELDLNAGIETKIIETATSTLPWVWTSDSTSFGTHHKGKLPNNGRTNVLTEIVGIN